jgi:hypothetical protein
MNEARLNKALSPPQGGVAAPTKQMERYLGFGAAGEVKHLLRQAF